MPSSLEEWIKSKKKEDEDKKKEAEAKAKQVAAAPVNRERTKDDAAFPVAKPVIQDERKEAVAALNADIQSMQAKPAVKAVPSYLPSSFPSAIQGPPAPVQLGNASNGIDAAANAWRTTPDKKTSQSVDRITQFQPTPYQPPDVGLSFDRPDTGPAPFTAQQTQAPTIQPYQPPKQYDFVQQPQSQPPTRSFLQANALQSPLTIAPLVVGEGQQPGGLLGKYGEQAGDYLKSWLPQSTARPYSPASSPAAPPIIKDFQGVNTGAPGIGDNTQSPTVGINMPQPTTAQPSAGGWLNNAVNAAVAPLAGNDPGTATNDWLASTPFGQKVQADIARNHQGLDPKTWWQSPLANVKDTGAVASALGGAVENVPIPFTNTKVGQVVQAGLTVPARALNPFDKSSIWRNPATFNTPGVQKANEALNAPATGDPTTDMMNTFNSTPVAAVGSWIRDTFMSQISKAQAVNNYIKTLPADKQNKVQMAYTLMQSGPEAMQHTVDDILNQGQNADALLDKARSAYDHAQVPGIPDDERKELSLIAAKAGYQWNQERNMSALDYVDKNAHPGAQFVGSLVTDPLNYLPVDQLWHAWKAARTARAFDVTAEEAMRVMPKAMDDARALLNKPLLIQDATKLVDAGAQKASILGPTFWQNFNPFRPTAESAAQSATTRIWNAATQLVAGVTSKEDARLLVQSWVDNPAKLVDGLTGLTSPAAQTASVDGVYKVGAGIVANKPLLDVMPVVQAAGDKLKGLTSLLGEGTSLLGEGTFNPKQFAAEIDNVIYETARGLYGLDPLTGIDAAVAGTKPVLARLPDGTGVINYVDSAGKVIKSSTPKVFYDAQQDFKALKTAASNASSANPIVKAAELPFQVTRAILSDMYLALNPGHWVRNAASATATLLTDGNYGTKNQGEMIRDLTQKFGGVFPERELQNTIAGTGQEIPHWVERGIGKNPYSALVNKANEVWTGLTNVAGVPFGEQAFKLTAKYNSFQRILRATWKEAAGGEFKAGLEALGIAPEVVNTLTHHIVDAGIQGNKQTLAEATRAVLTGSTIKQGLRELGIPDELLSMKGWAGISDVLKTHLPEQVDEATQAIKQIFTDELTHRGQILNDAPPQLGNHTWMNTEIAHDSASLIDSLRESGKQAGLPIEQVEATVQQLAKNLEESMTGAWNKFRQELPNTANPQEALGLAFDTYAKHSEIKQAARAGVDELGRNAARLQTPEAWAQKWQGTQDIYNKLVQDTQQLFAGTRARMLGVQGGTVEPYDWWKAIERYANYDEAAVQQARTAGSTLGSTAGDQAAWTASIDAGRQYVDKSLMELYDAFRRNPTQESLDLLVASQNKIDNMGAQAAAHLKPLREQAQANGDWSAYYAERNKVWGQYFDNASIHNKATQRIIVADGITSKYKDALSWEDPMYGQMRVVAPDTKTIVDTSSKARAITGQATGRTHEFDMWQVMNDKGEMIQVPDAYIPDEVKAAWQKIVNPGEEVDAAMGVVKQAPVQGPPVPTKQPPKGYIDPQTVTQIPPTQASPVQGPVASEPIFDPFKLEPGETVEKTLADNVAKSKTANGTKAPEMGEALGTHMLDKLKAAEQTVLGKLQTILGGQPNTLTEAQRVGAMDLLNQLLPAYDNALAGASQGASDAMNFGMLDPSNRRNVDVWLAHLFPFHYFWSRSARNWAERILVKPGVVHAYYNMNQAVAQENKQAGVPARLEGTLPMKSQVGFGPDRIANPLLFALPFADYYHSQYVNPEDANSDFEKWLMRVQQFTPGLMPMIQAGIWAGLDKVYPKADGTKRFVASDYAPQHFIPGIDLAGYAGQAITGRTAARLPGPMGPTYGDDYDPYRIGRKAAEIAAQGDDQTKAQAIGQYTQQYALNIRDGKPPMDKIPPEFQAIVPGMYTQASKGAAQARLLSKAGSFLTGVPGYEYTPEEKQMQGQQNELYKLGYNEFDNPYGSKTAMSQYRQDNPELQSYQSKGALVPNDNNPANDKTPPVTSQQTTAKIAEVAGIKEQQAKVVEMFLNNHNGKATYDEIDKLKEPFKAQLDALDAKYPEAGVEGAGGVPKYMSPQERAEWQKNQLVFGNENKPIDPGPNATPEQKAKFQADTQAFTAAQPPENPGPSASAEDRLAYYKAKEKYESDRLDRIDTSANAVAYEEGDPPTGSNWQNAFKDLTRGQYSSNVVSDAYLTNVSKAEKDWSYSMNLDNEVANAGRKANMAAVKAAVPSATYNLYEQYTAMAAGSEEKKAFLKAHPELAEANMIAYDKPQYDALVKQFGPNALSVYNNRPKYPEGTDFDALTDAQKATYSAQMDAYTKANPEYSQIKMWMDGRTRAYIKAPEGQFPVKDYGKDYNEAIKIFGPNIFKTESGYPYNGTSAQKAQYFKAHPELSGFWEWKKELANTPANYTSATEKNDNQFLDMANWYNGPRPYDSGRQPIGVPPVTEQKGPFLQPGGPWNPQAAPRALAPDAKPEYKGFQSGATTPSYLDAWNTSTPAATASPANTKTAADYAKQSDEDYYKLHGYYPGNSPKQQAWLASKAAYAERRKGVATEFGEDAAAAWKAYGNLPKGSKAREDYRALHPELKAYDMAAYNPTEYAAAKKLFGDTAWLDWATAPKSDETPESKAARAAYMDVHPVAKLLNAWVYGRPSAMGEQEPGEGVKYNFGADFTAAQKQFGNDIWNIFGGYKSTFDKGQKKAYFDKYPQLSEFFSWWYGNDKSGSAAGYGKGYGKGGYAGYGYTGGYGGGGGGSAAVGHATKIDPRYMDKNLIITDEDLRRNQANAWRPHNINLDWMKAGDRIGPENLKKWKR